MTGEHDASMYGLLGRRRSPRVDGLRPATVTEIDDPMAAHRVLIEYPWLSDDLRHWARVSQVGAGADRGILWFPEVGDEVLVAFLDGDPSHPVVIGSLFNGQDVPPQGHGSGTVNGLVEHRCLRTRAGHILEFDDTGGSEKIALRTGSEAIAITLDDASGKLTIQSSRDIEIIADGNLEIRAGGSLEVAAGADVTVTGSTIRLN